MKKGIAASKGYAIGNAFLKELDEIFIPEKEEIDVNNEKERLKAAIFLSKQQISELKDKTSVNIGEKGSGDFHRTSIAS